MIQDRRLPALRRFALAITALNVAGHVFLGFEQSWAQPLVALATAYGLELLLEAVDARVRRRPARFRGGAMPLANFLLSAHITALAVSMLLYANDRFFPIAFATAVAIGSKSILRISVGERSRHFFNPSNLGISATLLVFPWVGIAPPYHFTEGLNSAGRWILPAIIVLSGSLLNTRFTGRILLVLTWVAAFGLQALLRSWVHGTPVVAALLPMTGVAFILFSFYMISDPATTPESRRGQMLFGAAVGTAYGLLVTLHVVFGLFFSLALVCASRGLYLAGRARLDARVPARAALAVGTPAASRRSAAGDSARVAAFSSERVPVRRKS